MSTLIIKSKIWNKSNNSVINYKDKNFIKQKITIENSGILSRLNDKIYFKQTKNKDINDSHDNTNYMKDPQMSELISIEKNQNEGNFTVNCGDWAKDLIQLIDQNAVYFLYKGLTIENFLKEKQKYYVLNQGDIIKLGKIYLKILHIKLNSNRNEEEDKDKEDNILDKENNDKKKQLGSESDSNSNNDNKNESNINKENADNNKKNELIKRSCLSNSNDNKSDTNYKREKGNKSKGQMNNNFSPQKDNKNIKKNLRYNNKLNRSFDGELFESNIKKIKKENINMNRSTSMKFQKRNNISIRTNSQIQQKLNENEDNNKKLNFNDKDIINNKEKERFKTETNEIGTNQPKEKKQKGKICRICLSEEDDPIKNPLICPCTCKGSMKYIHYDCLKNWLNLKIESDLGYDRNSDTDQPTITYNTKDISCELCKEKLPDYIKHKKKIFNVSFYKPKYNKFVVLESIRDDNRRSKFIHIIPLNRKQIIKIGRLNNCDLSLPDFSISRVHCCMYIESGQLFLENNSKFGTKILVQNPKLVMSPQYPLCIEVQNTYLKLKIQKPFSLFSCCNVYTTSMTKMLVYQKQNERGFDLFCSMIFKEDDGEEDDDINDEKNKENKEDLKKSEIIDKKSNKSYKTNKKMQLSRMISNEDDFENQLKNLDRKDKEDIKRSTRSNLSEKEINYSSKEKELIDDDSKTNKKDKELIEDDKELIDDDCDKNKKQIDEEHSCFDDDKKSIKKDINDRKFNNSKSIQSKDEQQDFKYLNDSELKIERKSLVQNNKDQNSNNLNNTEFKHSEKRSMRSNEDKKSNEEKEEKKTKVSENERIIKKKYIINNNEIKKKEEVKKYNEFNKQKTINKKNDIKEESKNIIKNNEDKNIKKEEKEIKKKNTAKTNEEKNKINIIDNNGINIFTKDNSNKIISEKNKSNFSESYNNDLKSSNSKRKIPKKSIDLNTINDLTYKQEQDVNNNKTSAFDNYQSIFGLIPNQQNQSSLLLAPKHTKNKNLKKFDLKCNTKNNTPNDSNKNLNKYIFQYEESKKIKNV